MNIWLRHGALLALSATMLASAQAQPRPDGRQDSHGPTRNHSESRPMPNPGGTHTAPSQHSRPTPHVAPRPAPPHAQRPISRPQQHASDRHDFRRGERLPSSYRSNHYVVDNWRTHGLHAPQRGQHWVQVGNEYLLVSIATGVIASILAGH